MPGYHKDVRVLWRDQKEIQSHSLAVILQLLQPHAPCSSHRRENNVHARRNLQGDSKLRIGWIDSKANRHPWQRNCRRFTLEWPRWWSKRLGGERKRLRVCVRKKVARGVPEEAWSWLDLSWPLSDGRRLWVLREEQVTCDYFQRKELLRRLWQRRSCHERWPRFDVQVYHIQRWCQEESSQTKGSS